MARLSTIWHTRQRQDSEQSPKEVQMAALQMTITDYRDETA
ncbi:MAG: hypothetical protein WBM40_23590 [Thiohalocapsa sp.]